MIMYTSIENVQLTVGLNKQEHVFKKSYGWSVCIYIHIMIEVGYNWLYLNA